jgi:putative flavoprotein involved in K+ transport
MTEMTRYATVVVVGAGQAGLAASRCLTARSIDHVLLERGEVARSWRHERWDSLRLLTPNWMNRLPGWRYRGDDPDGYMAAAEVVAHLEGYRRSFGAPVHEHTAVGSIEPAHDGFHVVTDRGPWRCRAVVLATGAASTPRVPAVSAALPPSVAQVPAVRYRNPDQLGPGGVLVVGASSSGMQIADELARHGRDVTLAVGEHVRMPRTYRGRDIHWWMDAIGALDERWDEVEDLDAARRRPSSQLVGTPEKRDLDLNALVGQGVRVAGRFAGVAGDVAQLSGSLPALVANADLKLGRLLDRIDEHAAQAGWVGEPGDRPAPTEVGTAPTVLPLADFGRVVWAPGYRPTYPGLPAVLFDRRGRLRHDGGVLPVPGLYVLGLTFLRRRKSSFIDGAGADAVELTEHLHGHLDRVGVAA